MGDKGAALGRWLGPGRGERGACDPCTHGGFVQAYLSWYQPQTRCRLIYADMQQQPHVATPQDGYARYRDEALAGAVSQSYHRFLNTLDYSVNVFLFLACSLKCAG